MSDNLKSKQYQNLIDKIDNLTSIIMSQTVTIDKLSSTVNNQTKTIDKLQENLLNKNNDNEKLNAIIIALTEKIKHQEERLNKNSKNSSKPPSTDGYNKPKPKSLREKSGKLPGAQNGHKGSGFKLTREPDVIKKYHPEKCTRCELFGKCNACTISESRYDVDIQVTTVITEHQVLSCNCPFENSELITGEFPKGITGSKQYGENIKALAVSLYTSGVVSYNRIHLILSSAFGISISVGAIYSMVNSIGIELKDTVEKIRCKVSELPVAHFDETGLRVEEKLHWVHSASNDKYTYMTVEAKRGGEGMESSGVLPSFEGIAVHDFWSPYFKFINIQHSVCNAHLLRELNGVIENDPNQLWAKELIELLLQMKEAKETKLIKDIIELSPTEIQYFNSKYDEILKKAVELNPIAPKIPNKRGRQKKGKIRSLIDRFINHKGEVCLFMNNFNVPFDNNQAERDIRMLKVKQKVSGSFRTKDGADVFTTIMSYLGTATKHGINPFIAIKAGIKGKSSELLF